MTDNRVDPDVLAILKMIAVDRGIKYTPVIRGNHRPIYFWTSKLSMEGWWFNLEEVEFYNLCKKLKTIK